MMPSAAKTWDTIYVSGRAMRYYPSEDVVRFCARRLEEGMRVLDVGCGNGANLWFLIEQGYAVVGVDASEKALDLAVGTCNHRGLPVPRLIECDLSQLVRELTIRGLAGTFDAIIDCRTSQHLPWSAHAAAFESYRTLLAPDGWLFLLHLDRETHPDGVQKTRMVPNEPWTFADIEDDGVYAHNGLTCLPPGTALETALHKAGFVVTRSERVQRLDGGTWKQRLTISSHTALDAQRSTST